MRRFALCLSLLLLAPSLARAACTTATIGPRSVEITCTTGTEVCSGLTDVSGLDLNVAGTQPPVAGVTVRAEAASGQTLAGGTLIACVRDEVSGLWATLPDVCTITAAAERPKAPCTGNGFQVYASGGRFAMLPSGTTISSGSVVIRITAYGPKGERF